MLYASGHLNQCGFQADVIIDMATLTGAQAYASGKLHAALLTNSEEWERKVGTFSTSVVLYLMRNGRYTGVHCWASFWRLGGSVGLLSGSALS